MPLYEKGPVCIHYEEAGAGFPLLIIPGGGLNSTIAGLATTHPFNAMEEFKDHYRLFPWKEPKERIPIAVRQIRSFLRAHQPA